MINSTPGPADLVRTPEGYLLSGIGAIRAIEHVIAATLDFGSYLVELDEIGALESAPDWQVVTHAYALELGCPALTTRWTYDYATHQFRAVPPDRYYASLEPLEVPREQRLALITQAELFRILLGKLRTEKLRREMRLDSDERPGGPQASEARTRDVNSCG